MQHLLDFIHEHTLDEQVYLVVSVRGVETELLWDRRRDGDEWRLRPKAAYGDPLTARVDDPSVDRATESAEGAPGGRGRWSRVHRDVLLDHLRNHGANMHAIENELRAIVMTQIVFADMVLCDARKALGRDVVQKAVLSHRDFVGELNSALRRLAPAGTRTPLEPVRLSVIPGEGQCTQVRSGHLSLVPSARA